MSQFDVEFAYLLIWMSIFIYSILASLDLGSGFFYLISYLTPGWESVRRAFLSYSSARWESTNTFFVFIVVAGASYFPPMADVIATGWIVPISIVLVLFMVRAAFLVYSYYSTRKSTLFLVIYTVAGLLILPAMSLIISGATLNVTHISFLPATGTYSVSVDYAFLFSNPVTYLILLTAFFGQLMVSGAFNLFYDKDKHNAPFYARYTKVASIVTFATLVAEFQLYYPYAKYVFEHLLSNVGYIAASGVLFLVFLTFLFSRRYGVGMFVVLLASMVAGFAGLGLARFPYVIYPSPTAYTAFTDYASFSLLTYTFFAALVLLIPSLYFLNRMFRYPA
ncbi:MAG: cytochrome d ubiquinol oxidase subunit II [Methanomassiliicoccales archaeon]